MIRRGRDFIVIQQTIRSGFLDHIDHNGPFGHLSHLDLILSQTDFRGTFIGGSSSKSPVEDYSWFGLTSQLVCEIPFPEVRSRKGT